MPHLAQRIVALAFRVVAVLLLCTPSQVGYIVVRRIGVKMVYKRLVLGIG